MNSNVRHGLRPFSEVLMDWMYHVEDDWKKKGEPLPEPMKKGFADMRAKVNKPKKAA